MCKPSQSCSIHIYQCSPPFWEPIKRTHEYELDTSISIFLLYLRNNIFQMFEYLIASHINYFAFRSSRIFFSHISNTTYLLVSRMVAVLITFRVVSNSRDKRHRKITSGTNTTLHLFPHSNTLFRHSKHSNNLFKHS